MARSLTEIKRLAQEMLVFETYEQYDQEDLVEILKAADDLYHNDTESFLTDAEYDAIRRVAEQMNPAHSYFQGIGSEVRGGKIKLPHKMGSLTQVYEGETIKWITKYGLEDQQIVVSDKLDGSSALLTYDDNGNLQIAYSRGDGFEGADITRHLRKIPSVPQQVSNPGLVVRGEIIIQKSKFPLAQKAKPRDGGKQYKNPRNCVSGLMNASTNPDAVYEYVDFVAYEIIKNGDRASKSLMLDELSIKHGFLVPSWTAFKGNELSDDVLTKHLNDQRQKSKYEIDGVVLDVDLDELRQQINPTKDTLNPEFSRKYKVADVSNYAETEVIGVEWSISKAGYLKPTVLFKPVLLEGATISRATGFNARFIYQNKIGPGAIVGIVRAGSVIPYITTTISPMLLERME